MVLVSLWIVYVSWGYQNLGLTVMLDCLNLVDQDVQIDTRSYLNFQEYIQDGVSRDVQGFNIVHFNIRGLMKHYDELLMQVQMSGDIFDVIVLSETRKIADVSTFSIPNYTLHYNESEITKCDGVVVYIKNNLTANVTINQVNECKFLRMILANNYLSYHHKIGITAYYRSPATNTKNYIKNLELYLNGLEHQNLEIYVGDININLLHSDSGDTNDYLNILNSNGFTSYINKPTRVTQNSVSIIDHIFIKIKKCLLDKVYIEPAVIHTDMTDHFTTFVSIKKKISEETCGLSVKNKISTKIDYEKLLRLMSNENWEDVLMNRDSQESCNLFMEKLNNYITGSSSTEILKSNKYKKIKPWITTGLIKSINERNKLKEKLRKNHTVQLEMEYKCYRNKLNTLIKRVKSDYYQNEITKADGNYKKVWNIINDVTGKRKRSAIENVLLNNGKNVMVGENEEKADIFNRYFVELGVDMAKKIEESTLPENFQEENPNNSSIYLTPVTTSEIIILISNLKNNCTPGPDGISSKIIKLIHNYIVSPLVHIINLCFSQGKIPSQWKESLVTPVFKTGDQSLCIIRGLFLL